MTLTGPLRHDHLAGLGHLLRERRGRGRLCGLLGECGFAGGAVGGAQTGDAIWRGVSAIQEQRTTVVGQEEPLMSLLPPQFIW